jgi:hypothetical protein
MYSDPKREGEEPPVYSQADVPAIGISVQHQTDTERNLVFQMHLPFDCSPTALNAALDKVLAASARQAAKVKLPSLRRLLKNHEDFIKRATEDIYRLDTERDLANSNIEQAAKINGRRNPARSAQDIAYEGKNKADRANAVISLERHREDAALVRADIAELERAIAAEA